MALIRLTDAQRDHIRAFNARVTAHFKKLEEELPVTFAEFGTPRPTSDQLQEGNKAASQAFGMIRAIGDVYSGDADLPERNKSITDDNFPEISDAPSYDEASAEEQMA